MSWRLLQLLPQHEAAPWPFNSRWGLDAMDELMQRPDRLSLLPTQLLLQETA
jgi:hypothetical protein